VLIHDGQAAEALISRRDRVFGLGVLGRTSCAAFLTADDELARLVGELDHLFVVGAEGGIRA
jgi:hypothetical protein